MTTLLSYLGLDVPILIAAFLGAMVSAYLSYRAAAKDPEATTKPSLKSAILGGAVGFPLAAYAGPFLAEYVNMAKLSIAVTFLVGVFGLAVAEALYKETPTLVAQLRKKYLGDK